MHLNLQYTFVILNYILLPRVANCNENVKIINQIGHIKVINTYLIREIINLRH